MRNGKIFPFPMTMNKARFTKKGGYNRKNNAGAT